MVITFDRNDKNCKYYERLVENSEDISARKEFKRHLDPNIIEPLMDIYQRMTDAPNAAKYNDTESGNNRIGRLEGGKDRDPLTLKVRINRKYRKLFYFNKMDGDKGYCTIKDWSKYRYEDVTHIHVYNITPHSYKP
jgi:hypothetical protein